MANVQRSARRIVDSWLFEAEHAGTLARESRDENSRDCGDEEDQGRSPLIPTGRTLPTGTGEGEREPDGFARKSSRRNFKCRRAHRSRIVQLSSVFVGATINLARSALASARPVKSH